MKQNKRLSKLIISLILIASFLVGFVIHFTCIYKTMDKSQIEYTKEVLTSVYDNIGTTNYIIPENMYIIVEPQYILGSVRGYSDNILLTVENDVISFDYSKNQGAKIVSATMLGISTLLLGASCIIVVKYLLPTSKKEK